MITRKTLYKLCDKYIHEVLAGPLGPSDLKYKGNFHWVQIIPMQQYKPMTDPPKSISMLYSAGRIEIETRLNNMFCTYDTRVKFSYKNPPHVVAFGIPKESWGRQALEYYFKEYCRIFEEETGLIKLTPEEEMDKQYKEAKKAAIAAAYSVPPKPVHVGEFDMELLKKQIENLKNQTSPPKQWVVQSPDGNMHVASLDTGQQVLNNIFAHMNAAKAAEVHMGMSTFNQVKKLAEKHFQETGEFPSPDSFVGMEMQVVVDPGVPDGAVVFHTAQPPKHHGTVTGSFGPPKSVKKTVQSYGNAGNELTKVIPALSARGIGCPEPATCEYAPSAVMQMKLSELIIHLNDSHKWPRSATDPNPYNKPNIADWIDEVCLIHGLDQSFHPEGEGNHKKQAPNDPWGINKKPKNEGASLSHSIVDEPVVIDEEWLNKYEQKLIKDYTNASYFNLSKLKGWINDGA